MRLLRRLAAVSVCCAAATLSLGVAAGPAHAEPGYTYWGYYQLVDGEWQFAQKGAGELTPDDGDVEGWRYATTVGTTPRPPRTDLSFAEICADVEAADAEKRVGVVIDYGTAGDAPQGEEPPTPEALCAVVPDDANGQQVLSAVADVRVEGGLNCGINGFPASGCSLTIENATAPESEPTVEFAVPATDDSEPAAEQATAEDGGVSWGLVGAGVLVLALAAAGARLARRRA
ncbi:MAG TPA: SCO2322 family protein [Nocardioidaceae bacterium]|nr:SCO2322 family protein [Nocardioidaceae bacterium]